MEEKTYLRPSTIERDSFGIERDLFGIERDNLAKFLAGKDKQIMELSVALAVAQLRIDDNKEKTEVKSILVNEKKRIITVVFGDDDVRMAKCHPDDNFSKEIGVSLCIARHMCGSRTNLNKLISKANVIKKEEKTEEHNE